MGVGKWMHALTTNAAAKVLGSALCITHYALVRYLRQRTGSKWDDHPSHLLAVPFESSNHDQILNLRSGVVGLAIVDTIDSIYTRGSRKHQSLSLSDLYLWGSKHIVLLSVFSELRTLYSCEL